MRRHLFAGGALAILAALAIACDSSMALRKDQVICYAIAAPRVGNYSFAAAYGLLVPHTWSVINDQACSTALNAACAPERPPKLCIQPRL